MKKREKNKDQRKICVRDRRQISGFTLIEVLVAMAIFLVVITVAVGIFTSTQGGTQMIFGMRNVQDNGRYILESMSKEIRMGSVLSVANAGGGTILYGSLSDGENGPYESLTIKNSSGNNISYVFDNVNKRITRSNNRVSSSKVEVTGGFYIYKAGGSVGVFPARVTVSLKIKNVAAKVSQQVQLNLQSTVSSRQYAP
jgi:prepilin-type N-terminal cleavage/methylation domain-containing protein